MSNLSEKEINDNLIMLKYFIQEEGDENWQDYCNAIERYFGFI